MQSMHWIDWTVMSLPLIICGAIALYARRYVKSVADFMAGGRHAGRYLICTARSEQGSGAVVYAAMFQAFMGAGFAVGWWGQISTPIGLLVMITGFVIYRYRQTRAMTLGQFFEMRYSRKFRLFAGYLGFFAGLINFGVIPVIGARFMVFFLGFPVHVHVLGLAVPTYLLMMGLFLTLCVIMTTAGGQISVLLTDCAEGMFSQLFYTFIAIVLLVYFFDWPATRHVLMTVFHPDSNVLINEVHEAGDGKSYVNPFDTGHIQTFNIWYVMIGILLGNYRTLAWQNQHAFNSSGASPHEQRMGGILGRWRGFAAGVMVTLLAVCAMTYLGDPAHVELVKAALVNVPDEATRSQMTTPVALNQMLPIGVKGALLSICLMGIIAGDGMHLHSWGSIFIQDVILPMRKDKPLTPKQHITLLRLSIIGVALWAFVFGALWPQMTFIQLWWSITEAIFVSGAGIAIIGGLYWAKGTTKGAWVGMIVGSTVAIGGIAADSYFEHVLHRHFYVNSIWMSLFAMLAAVSTYVTVSYMTCRKPHNMDKLLHRGAYAVKGESELPKTAKKVNWLYRIVTLGIDEKFSRGDRWVTCSMTVWSMLWFVVFIGVSLMCMYSPWSPEAWADYWCYTGIYLPVAIGAVTTVWFTWGCSRDMIVFFRKLKEERVDDHDDGTVRHDDDLVIEETLSALQGAAAIVPTGAGESAAQSDAEAMRD